MNSQPWAFETLAQANRATLEAVLRQAIAPDPQQLAGRTYRGWTAQLPV